jgi:hypothetical protein
MTQAQPAPVPEEHAMQATSADRRQRSGHGVRFRESMSGRLRIRFETDVATGVLRCRRRGR